MEVRMIESNNSLIRNPDFVFRKVVEETILVPVHMNVAEMDHIYTLNDIGAFIWEKLDEPRSIEELQECLLGEYDVEPEALNADLQTFVEEMLTIGAFKKVD